MTDKRFTEHCSDRQKIHQDVKSVGLERHVFITFKNVWNTKSLQEINWNTNTERVLLSGSERMISQIDANLHKQISCIK